MYVSELMKIYLPEIEYQVVAEREVGSLGLVSSETSFPICSFVENRKYIGLVASQVKMLFVTSDILENIDLDKQGCIVVDNPKAVFFLLHNQLKDNEIYIRKSFPTEISKTAKISKLAYIEKTNVKIGNNVVIEPFVTIYKNTVIEDNCIIRSGARIGGEGFQEIQYDEKIFSVEHLGGTILHHDVEVQNNTCIDKAIYPWDNTEIGKYTKFDTLVHVEHAVKIGESCMITGNVEIAGRSVIGDNVWIGIGSTIRNGLKIGNNARINIGSVVVGNVKERGNVTGNFAIPHEKFLDNLKKSLCKNNGN